MASAAYTIPAYNIPADKNRASSTLAGRDLHSHAPSSDTSVSSKKIRRRDVIKPVEDEVSLKNHDETSKMSWKMNYEASLTTFGDEASTVVSVTIQPCSWVTAPIGAQC